MNPCQTNEQKTPQPLPLENSADQKQQIFSARPLAATDFSEEDREKILSSAKNTDDNEACWIWTRTRNSNGYGVFYVIGDDGLRSRQILAHRASFAIHNKILKADILVCHKCDNPSCINPNHLFAGTALDNHRDMTSKGRLFTWRPDENGNLIKLNGEPAKAHGKSFGERNGMAKITEETVRTVRSMFAQGRRQFQIARELGLTNSHVHEIIRRRKWTHVK